MTIGKLVEFLDTTFPPEYQEDYDNSGFLVGSREHEAMGAIVAVDLTMDVIDEAIKNGCNMIVTHHPLIFGGLKRITSESETGRMVMALVKQDIAVYAAHTNLDNMKEGVNGILANKLGLTNCRILKPFATNADLGAGMVGTLPHPVATAQFIDDVKSLLGLPVVRCSALCRNEISKVAICGGSGSFLIGDAIAAGADIFLTADLKYHDFQRAEGRLILADIGHYESEQFAKELIYCAISEKFCKFAVRISEANSGYINYI